MSVKEKNNYQTKHVRGSVLLLLGRSLAIALNMLTQVLIVRYLSKTDYGTFAYALAIVSMLTTVNCLGLDRAVSRFIPIHEEKNDLASASGVIILAISVLVALGGATILLVIGFRVFFIETTTIDPAIITILVALITLAPVNAIDHIFEALLSVYGKSKAIFFRKYILGPCLKLTAISLTLLVSGDVYMLAVTYMLAGTIGLLLYGLLLKNVLEQHNLMQRIRPGMFKINYREIFYFSLPTFAADLGFAIRPVLIVMLLEYFHGLSSVAEFRSIVPIARLNSTVLLSFSLLFIPLASRLFAQKNRGALGEMQSLASLWITMLSYPFFAICIVLAEPVIILLFGERYSSSTPVLMILAVGYFFHSALGLHQRTLRAMGKVSVILYIEIISISLMIAGTLLLTPAYGATGGATAATVSMIIYALLISLSLWKISGKNPLPWKYTKIYLIVGFCSLGMWLGKTLFAIDSTPVLFAFVLITSILVMLSSRKLLQITDMFPEVIRLPRLIRRLLGVNI